MQGAICNIFVDVLIHSLPLVLSFDKVVSILTHWWPILFFALMSTVKCNDLGVTSAKNS